ncbi:MAG: hypothetical protein JXM74_05045 [Fusobacteriaceae bacterium]|nr:hypothetical protein [Fusobacteriaceae bacterium]
MKILVMLFLAINLFAYDFRYGNWGDSSETIFKKEKLSSISYKENLKNKSFQTFKGNYVYNYSVDEYSFLDNLESLGEFRVTYSFLKDKFYKGSYSRDLKENDKSFERMKQYLIWKYGDNYQTYGLDDSFEWNNGDTKIVLNLFLGRNYTVEYFANSKYMKELIDEAENGREIIKELGTEFKEFNKLKEKL